MGQQERVSVSTKYDQLTEDVAEVKREVDAPKINDMIDAAATRLKIVASEIEQLKKEFKSIRALSEVTLSIRNQEWTHFLRTHDGHQELSESDYSTMQEENEYYTYEGAPAADRYLFLEDLRSDVETWKALYGLSLSNFDRYNDAEDTATLKALKDHATVLIQYPGPILSQLPPNEQSPLFNTKFGKMEIAFRDFVKALADGGCDTTYQTKEQSVEMRAYRKYLQALNDYRAKELGDTKCLGTY